MPLQQLTPRIYQLPFSEAEDRPCLGYIRGERFSLMVESRWAMTKLVLPSIR